MYNSNFNQIKAFESRLVASKNANKLERTLNEAKHNLSTADYRMVVGEALNGSPEWATDILLAAIN